MELWSNGMPHAIAGRDFVPYITPYVVEGAKTAILICPGGAYWIRAEHEGKAIAEWLNTIGVSAFVLEYRVTPYRAPAEGSDVQRAMRVVRSLASEYGMEHIGVMGFSAGGHLAATASVHYDKHFYDATDAIDALSARPDFSVLCYPVIDMFDMRHDGSRNNLLGSNPSKAQKEFYSLHLQVTKDTPPAFLWHTAADNDVPVENSMYYAMALAEHKVPYGLHIFPKGGHGMGLAKEPEHYHVHSWAKALQEWMQTMGFLVR